MLTLGLFQKEVFSSGAKGDIVPLKVTSRSHWNGLESAKAMPDSHASNFAEALNRALSSVNDSQINSEKFVQKLVSDPKSINLHEVLVGVEKARMSLTFTKTISDLMVKTYRELINLR